MKRCFLPLLAFLFSGCGGLITKPTLEPLSKLEISFINKEPKPKVIEYRVLNLNTRGRTSNVRDLYARQETKDLVIERLKMSLPNQNLTLIEYKDDLPNNLSDEGAEKYFEAYYLPKFPIEGDYLIQFEFLTSYNLSEGEFRVYLFMFHALSVDHAIYNSLKN